ncbi:vWA domain-containing protein [Sandaracinus amylolyticus]|uniref:VWFA domain-containing protein n=1 Tax=Sandaracinus amylolyticus TaxID=927083 RepID=A0A0F6SEC4_9BACT|nr:VWA domain-containing protein [Sandaracinus amylolyticus]AKF04949.1 hypothetical protein DB32_002098 [Sandaracinus amylolyticus]
MSARLAIPIAALAAMIACTGRTPPETDGGPPPDVPARPDAGDARDAGPEDPFDPSSSCAAWVSPLESTVGSLLLLVDQSVSMQLDGREATRWEELQEGIASWIEDAPAELEVGLVRFPEHTTGCATPLEPTVAIAPLSAEQRAQLVGALGELPFSSETPLTAAVESGFALLDRLPSAEPRGIVLLTDGLDTCHPDGPGVPDRLVRLVRERATQQQQPTVTISLGGDRGDLSVLAANGGAPSFEGCAATCRWDTPIEACCQFLFVRAGLDEAERLLGESCSFDLPWTSPPSARDLELINLGLRRDDGSIERLRIVTPGRPGGHARLGDDGAHVVLTDATRCERVRRGEAALIGSFGCAQERW